MDYQLIDQMINGDEKTQVEAIKQQISSQKDLLTTLLNEDEYAKLEEIIERDKNIFAYINTKKIVDGNLDYILGTYIGYLQAMEEIAEINIRKENATKVVTEIGYDVVKKIFDMLINREYGLIETNINIAGIDKDNFERIMYLLVRENLIKYTRPGRYKFYYISEFGKKYYNEYFTMNNQEEKDNES